eukprot:TRINITY_DN8745_c0_g1_i4.p1 TRINITY_DN8745_c0_g1~~TRINITY_DN8745_c0_g1_i4.p1  ORF type:complete len:432 (+),score=99.93 TRINITY_DN8745_c0_g1_i4:152-1297(+)
MIKNGPPSDRGSLLKIIREQVEFYFSDENLPQDVFLIKQLEKDKTKQGFVALKELAKFPKMKQLTHDLGAIREALSTSGNLILSQDGSSVRRKIPLHLPEDTTEKRTLYVTKLAKECDRESLMALFSNFGRVMRLDLPMDKKSGDNKGMAFVEYSTIEEFQTALTEFTNNADHKMLVKPFKTKGNNTSSNKEEKEKEKERAKEKDNSTSPIGIGKKTRMSCPDGALDVVVRDLDIKKKTVQKGDTTTSSNNSNKKEKSKRTSSDSKRAISLDANTLKAKRNSLIYKSGYSLSEGPSSSNTKIDKRTPFRTSADFSSRDLPENFYDTFNKNRSNSRLKRQSRDPRDEIYTDLEQMVERPKIHKEERPLFVPVSYTHLTLPTT